MHEHRCIPLVWYSVAIMRAHKRDERPFVALRSPALLAYKSQSITGAFVHRGAGRVDACGESIEPCNGSCCITQEEVQGQLIKARIGL